MNHQSKYRENERFIQAFAEHLDECNTIEQKIKLSGEIGRLIQENKSIDLMPYQETQKEVITHYINVPAIL